jgi:uncharacterized protein (TIGR02266 family)
MADARKDKRTLLSLKIRYKSATLEDFIERYSNDISRGGVFIKAKNPLAVGTLLKFEFLLLDQSTLIHGVGRVVWRRDEHEADADNPAGMGIKFIKMAPESRAIVQRIVDERAVPGVFDHGKEGIRRRVASDADELGGDDRTKVRHVSEFLASALEEGGAGPAARAGAEQARRSSDLNERRAAARGAFSAFREAAADRTRSASEAPSRGAMSAFGGSTSSAGGSRRSSAAPALHELDAEDDDFLDEDTTKVKEMPLSDYPDADATAVAKDISPFLRERRPTPVVPMPSPSGSPLEDHVPDLFGAADPDSFGPPPDEVIDPRLLDQSVPPRAATVPEAGSSADEVFQVPKAAPAVEDLVQAAEKQRTRGWLVLLLLILLLFASAVAALRFGLLDDLIERVAAGFAPQAAADEGIGPTLAARPVGSVTDSKVPQRQPSAEQDPAAQPVAPPQESSKPPTEPAQAPLGEVPAARMGKLRVFSVPNRAFVSINGKAVGRTPIEVDYEVGTELHIFSKARGFLARREKIVMTADQQPLKLVLSALPYIVDVATDPPGAKVTVVGSGEGLSPTALQVKTLSGARKVVISKDGYKTVTKSLSRASFVEEPRRKVAKISVKLAPEGAPRAATAAETSDVQTPGRPSEPEQAIATPPETAPAATVAPPASDTPAANEP